VWRLGAADVSRLLTFLRASYGTLDRPRFRVQVLAALRRLISCDIISYNEVNARTSQVAWLCEPADALDFPDSTAIFNQHIPQHPLIGHYARTSDDRVLKISDFLSRARFHRLGLYHEFYRRVSVEYQIACVLPAQPPAVIGIALNRGRRDFNERDRSLLQLVRPHLAQAFQNACVVTQLLEETALLNRALEESSRGIVGLTPAGRVLWMSPQAERWMGKYFPDRARGGRWLPEPLQRWLTEQQALLIRTNLPPPRLPFEIEQRGESLVARLLSEPEQLLLLLEERSDPVSLAGLEALGLTRREAEVLAWLARGKTNAEIGKIASLSARTVEKHLEHIFQKLGVENRTAAAIRALESDAHVAASPA